MSKSTFITLSGVASSTPYDNTDCDLEAETVQEAIDELCNRENAPELIKVKCADFNTDAGCKPKVFKFTELVSQNLCEITKVKC